MSLNLKSNPLKSQDFSKSAISLSRQLAFLKEESSACTRCGACLQGCLSYKTLNMENFSPRGRAQLLNLIIERKIDLKQDQEMLLKCINSCSQCGQCSQFCAIDLRIDKFIFELKSHFIKSSFRISYLKFYQKYSALLFPFFSFAKGIKQTKKKEVKSLLLTSKAGLKFASCTLALLPFSRVSKQAIYLNEVIYSGNKKLINLILKDLKKEIKSFKNPALFTDNIILWRFLKKQEGFEEIKFILPDLPSQKAKVSKSNICIINNNSLKENKEDDIYSCLNANFFVEFTQEMLHTPAGLFWRSLSLEEERVLSSCLKRYEGATLIALCAEDKVFYDRLKKKSKAKLNILTLAQIINEQGRAKK